MGIMLVYDVTDERSFNNIRNWIRNTEQYASEGVNKILIGNKCDMAEQRVIEKERGQALADEYGLKFLETSALSKVNVEEAFMILARYPGRGSEDADGWECRDVKKRLIDSDAAKPATPSVNLGESAFTRMHSSCCWGGASSTPAAPDAATAASSLPTSPRSSALSSPGRSPR